MHEEKIVDQQEENLQQIKKSQSELAGQKQGYEHQISEFKKRIEELEESATTYKSQLANQKSLQGQQEQISKNEIQKLENDIQLVKQDNSLKQKQVLELEAKKMSLEKDLLQKTDEQAQSSEQLTQTNKQKEELITRLTNLEDNYQKGEMLREQFKLKLQQSTQNIERLEKLNKTTEGKLEDAMKESQQLREEFGKEKELMKQEAGKVQQDNASQVRDLKSQISSLQESVHDKDMLIQVANQQIQNHQKIEDKLKNQLVDVEKNQKASSS